MAYSTIVKTKRDGTLVFADNAAANTLTVAFEAGDFSADFAMEGVQEFLDRGRHSDPPAIRYSDDAPITGSFTCYLRDISDATYATVEEILLQSGQVGSTWVSTMGANGEVFTLSLTWTIEGTDHGDASDHVLTFPYCSIRGSMAEGDPNTLTINFTSFVNKPSVIT